MSDSVAAVRIEGWRCGQPEAVCALVGFALGAAMFAAYVIRTIRTFRT